ncbi:MAG: hypothetical protein WDN69_31535 [Aliidongia sp.]
MNVGYLLYHSIERPRDLFLVDGEREVRFDEAVRDLRKFVGAVREFGLARGNSVAIGCDDFYTHLLLILAFEHLGITTASFHDKEGRNARRCWARSIWSWPRRITRRAAGRRGRSRPPGCNRSLPGPETGRCRRRRSIRTTSCASSGPRVRPALRSASTCCVGRLRLAWRSRPG